MTIVFVADLELVHLITGQRLPYATLMYVWDAQLPVGTVVNYGDIRLDAA